MPRASVVIPAHDEAETIERTLHGLLTDAWPGELDVVVVCNGCTDDTAARARSVAGVRVREIASASKIAALREGDRATEVFPRIYLDADVPLGSGTARALVEALERPGVAVAGVPGRVDLAAAGPVVRLFFEFRQRLPVFHHGVLGAGVYALNATGRSAFGVWPDVTGDDQFVYRSFPPEQRVTLSGHHTVVAPPPDLRSVIRRGVRVRQGNRQLSRGGGDHQPLPPPAAGFREALRDAVRSPRGVLSAAVFVTVTLVVRALDRLGVAGDW